MEKMGKTAIIFLALPVLAAIAIFYFSKMSAPAAPAENPNRDGQAAKTRTIKLYYYNPEKDKDAAGNAMCSRAGLAPVEREVLLTKTPVQDAVNLLLKGGLAESESAAGIAAEFPLPGLALKGANLDAGILTLEFDDPQNKTSGGACRAGILWFQIEATAKQFSGVEQVRFIPETLFQP